MARFWLSRMLKKVSHPASRSDRKRPAPARCMPNLESLGDRVVPTVTADSFRRRVC